MAKSKSGEKGPNKMALVKEAMDTLGNDAKPQQLQEHIQTAHNLSIPTSIISNYKFTLRKRGGAAGGRGRRAAGGGGGIRIEDFEAVRGLVGRLGADQVKRLVDVLG